MRATRPGSDAGSVLSCGTLPNAVDAAIGAGASYADARGVFRRSQSVATKNGNVEAVSDVESEGIGVRVLVDGAWGFAGRPAR